MHNYNDLIKACLPAIQRSCRLAALLAFGLALGGCATAPQQDDTVATAADSGMPLSTSQPGMHALDTAVRDDAPREYVVQRGDTLWDIAGQFLHNPWYWPRIWHANPDIDNPDLIYPGDVLVLTQIDGQPRIERSRHLPSMPVHKPIASLPADAVRTMLATPRLVTRRQLHEAAHIVAFKNQRLLGSRNTTAYVRGLSPEAPPHLDIIRINKPLTDPDSGDRLGILTRSVGRLAITRRGDSVDSGRITRSTQAIRRGDHLLPARTRQQVSQFHLRTPKQPVHGTIMANYNGNELAGQYDVVVINRGRDDGLARGNLLRIHGQPHTVTDPVTDDAVTLPAQQQGVVMLFDVQAHLSLGIILEATHAIRVDARVGTRDHA